MSHNIGAFLTSFNLLMQRDIPFVCAKALTDTAKLCQEEVRRQLPQRFTIRNNWVSQGIRIVPASKRSRSVEARIYSKDDFMQRQETGGIKAGTTRVAVPAGVRSNTREIIPKRRRPRALLNRKDVFIKNNAVWQRVSDEGARGLIRLYTLTPAVTVKPRFEFFNTVKSTFDTHIVNEVSNAINSVT